MIDEESQKFITDQITVIDGQIKQLTIMQRAWNAGGNTFKAQLDDVSAKLGSWIAVKEDLERQISEAQ